MGPLIESATGPLRANHEICTNIFPLLCKMHFYGWFLGKVLSVSQNDYPLRIQQR